MGLKLQYREIVRLAKRNKLTFGKGYANSTSPCVHGIIGVSLIGKDWYYDTRGGLTEDKLSRALGLNEKALQELESGYEGWPVEGKPHPQYLVGKRLAKLRMS